MIVKVGYIGSQHSVMKIQKVAEDISGIKLLTYTYKSPADVAILHKKAANEVDVICFSGIVSYYYRNRSINGKPETIISPFHKYMLAASILSAIINHQVTTDQMSIDLPDKRLLEKVEHDITFQMNESYIYDYHWIYDREPNRKLSFSKMTEFHEQLYLEKKTKIAITSIHYVYDQLIAKNIPAIYMVDHDDNMKKVLNNAKKRVLFSWLQNGMMAVIYFKLHNEQVMTQTTYDTVISTIQSMITQPVQSSLKNDQTIVMYTTRGAIEKQFIPKINSEWIQTLSQTLNEPFHFGIGYGRELFEAEEHAEQALLSTQMSDNSNGFLLTDMKELIGPLVGKTGHEHIRTNDDWLYQLIDETKTTLKTMQRFIDFIHMNDYQPFTVRELAAFSNVTVRTSERFIKRLHNAGVVFIYGQEQNYSQGRPRQVYAIDEQIEHKLRNNIVL